MSYNYDDKHPQETDASPNSTYFVPAEAPPSKRRRFKRMWYYNEDLKWSRKQYNAEQLRERDKSQLFEAIASSLDLSHNVTEQAKEILVNADLSDAVEGQYTSLEVYCFAICAIVYNHEQDSFKRKYVPEKVTDKNPERFEVVRDSIEATKREVRQAIDELKSLVSYDG